MKKIKDLYEMIEEELRDSEKYAKCAIGYKDADSSLANVLFDLSNDEMRHMNILHGEVERIINQYQNEHGTPPAAMQAVYDYLHDRFIKKALDVKACQDMYRA